MEMDSCKLFIGGVSWETSEDRLREYFQTFGEVVEAVIMKDRATGRARGFGFVVFGDPNVAERVVLQKHMIDGKTVEAKKAVPRDDQTMLNKSNSSMQGWSSPANTKKIFVGGLASSVTEAEFKRYFGQFGTITDVVVMYDHRTRRPRGFGFITYDSEDAVDKVLHRTFHELNGKMVEVKVAVPKEMSPTPNRNLNNLGSSSISDYTQGFNPHTTPIIGYNGVKAAPVNRSGFSPFGHGYGMELNLEAKQNYGPGLEGGFGRPYSPAYSASVGRYGNGGGGKSPGWRDEIWGYGGSECGIKRSLNGNSRRDLVGSIGEKWGSRGRSNGGGVKEKGVNGESTWRWWRNEVEEGLEAFMEFHRMRPEGLEAFMEFHRMRPEGLEAFMEFHRMRPHGGTALSSSL